MKEKRFFCGLLPILISGMTFGLLPGAVTICYKLGATRETMLVGRYLVLILVLLPFVLRKKGAFRVYKEHFWPLFAVSAAGAATPLMLYGAYRHMATGMVTTLHFLYPALVMLLEWIFFKKHITTRRWLCLALCAGGVFFMTSPAGGINGVGLALTLGSTITWSLYIIGVDHFRPEGVSSLQMMFYVSLNSFAILLVYGWISGGLHPTLDARGWLAVAGVCAATAILGSLLFIVGIRHTDGQTAAIASTLEPITSIIFGVLALNEPFQWRSAVGSVLILAAVVLVSLKEKEKGAS